MTRYCEYIYFYSNTLFKYYYDEPVIMTKEENSDDFDITKITEGDINHWKISIPISNEIKLSNKITSVGKIAFIEIPEGSPESLRNALILFSVGS